MEGEEEGVKKKDKGTVRRREKGDGAKNMKKKT